MVGKGSGNGRRLLSRYSVEVVLESRRVVVAESGKGVWNLRT